MEIILKQPYSFLQIGKRANQEDARFPDCDMPQGVKPAFVVCDGVGGLDKGEVASRTVANAIGSYMSNVDLTQIFDSKTCSLVLEYAFSELSKAIKEGGREMATTVTFVCFHRGGAFCAHIGDSRIYHIRPNVGILYRSEDHSLVNALVHSGNITPEEAINHPQNNVITRCMGYVEKNSNRSSATSIQIDDIEGGDYFFLCSDGVLHNMEDSRLIEILSSEIPDKEKMSIIAELCESSSDNNTAYLIGVDSVINEMEDKSDKQCEHDLSAIDTTPLDSNNNEVIEVSAHGKKSIEERVSNFINKLF